MCYKGKAISRKGSQALRIAALGPGSTLPNSTSERSPALGKARGLFLVDGLLPLDRELEAQALATDCTRCSSSAFRQPHQLTSGCPQRAMTAPLLWCLCREQETTVPSRGPIQMLCACTKVRSWTLNASMNCLTTSQRCISFRPSQGETLYSNKNNKSYLDRSHLYHFRDLCRVTNKIINVSS